VANTAPYPLALDPQSAVGLSGYRYGYVVGRVAQSFYHLVLTGW
jgi:hypothetical protein